jgi:hypothetical protein
MIRANDRLGRRGDDPLQIATLAAMAALDRASRVREARRAVDQARELDWLPLAERSGVAPIVPHALTDIDGRGAAEESAAAIHDARRLPDATMFHALLYDSASGLVASAPDTEIDKLAHPTLLRKGFGRIRDRLTRYQQ